ncbi:ATP-binding protein [Actinacidiphila soli]|uniref:ATP-binding protein n=1 Tax=Actinacidiphila soli TaxID=2487275 RepID=UPI001F0CBEE7|nr:ATP-binding protein [Actinacidiphila soli]
MAEHIDDVRVCVSELTSNALVHGSLTGDGFLLKLTTDEDFLHIEVHDRSALRPHLRKPTDNQVSDRGLLIVEEFSDGWGVEERGPLEKVAWSRFKATPLADEEPSC